MPAFRELHGSVKSVRNRFGGELKDHWLTPSKKLWAAKGDRRRLQRLLTETLAELQESPKEPAVWPNSDKTERSQPLLGGVLIVNGVAHAGIDLDYYDKVERVQSEDFDDLEE